MMTALFWGGARPDCPTLANDLDSTGVSDA